MDNERTVIRLEPYLTVLPGGVTISDLSEPLKIGNGIVDYACCRCEAIIAIGLATKTIFWGNEGDVGLCCFVCGANNRIPRFWIR